EDEKLVFRADVMQNVLPAARSGLWNLHSLHWRFPLSASDYVAPMAGKADQDHVILPMSFAHKLAHVDHSLLGHIGEASVANMRVVFPNNRLGPRAMMLHEAFQRFDHVPIPDVPGVWAAVNHGSIIVLGVLDHDGILLCMEVGFAAISGM